MSKPKTSESEEKYRLTLDRISDGFVSLDKDWCYTYMNKLAGEIFKRDPKKMIGKHIWTEFPEGVGQPFHKAYEEAMAEQQYVYLEEYYPPYDKWFENHIYPSSNGLSIYFQDITEKKRSEKERIELQKRNEALINSTSDLLWSVSNDYKLIAANHAFIEALKENGGYWIKPGDDILSPDHFPEDYLNYWKEIYRRGLSGERVRTEVFVPRPQSADLNWFELRIDVIYLNDKINGIACATTDITNRKKAEEQMAKSEKLYSNLFENMQQGFAYCKAIVSNGKAYDFTYLSVNKEYERILGLKNISGKKNSESFPGSLESDRVYVEILNEVALQGKTVKFDTYLMPVDKWLSVFLYNAGEENFVLLIDEITDRKKADDEIKENEKFLKAVTDNFPRTYLSVIDKSMTVIFSGGEEFKIQNLDPQLFNNKTVQEVFAPFGNEVLETVINAYNRTFEGEPQVFELFINGQFQLYKTVPLVSEQEEVNSILAVVENISDKRKAELELKASEEKYRTLIEQASDGILMIGVQGNITLVNTALCNILGYTEAELLKMT